MTVLRVFNNSTQIIDNGDYSVGTFFHYFHPYLLWNILRKFGCPPTFIAILQFHTGMCAQVVMAGYQSSNFPVEVGVKQACVLAPIIFNLLLVAMTLVSHHDLQSSDCVGIEYRLVVSSTCDVSRPKLRLLLL